MNTPEITVSMPQSLPYQLDHDAWVRHLREQIKPDWRPAEFDPGRWLFTGDPDNPLTTSTRCKVRHCDTVVTSRCLCNQCRRALTDSDLDEAEFMATFRPLSLRERRTGQGCVVGSDDVNRPGFGGGVVS